MRTRIYADRIFIYLLIVIIVMLIMVATLLIIQNNAMYQANQDLAEQYFETRLLDSHNRNYGYIPNLDQIEKVKKKMKVMEKGGK